MANYSAKDVAELRKATGAGMMDCKNALEEAGGDLQAAMQILREKGLAGAAKRSDREAAQGAIALSLSNGTAAMVELRSETDFVAKSPQFVALAQELADKIAAEGESAVDAKAAAIEDLKVSLKENISLGRVVRFEAGAGNVLDSYLHVQSERGVNGVLVEVSGGDQELAHDIAVHIAFARPRYLRREDVPADVVDAERQTLENLTRNEGKPEQAIPKIVEGRLNGFFKEIVLLEQPFAKDDKRSVRDVLGSAEVVRYAQFEIGA